MSARQQPRMPKVLLIDDDAELRVSLVRTLSKFGYDTLHAPNGAMGLEVLQRHPDIVLVLVDRHLQDMDGLDILRKLQERAAPPPVVFLSAKSSKADVLACIKAGANDYVLKPVNLGRLVLKINNLVDHFRSEHEEVTEESPDYSIPAQISFVIQDVSETGCCFRSNFPLQQNAIVLLESREMAERLNLQENLTLPVRVANCGSVQSGKGYNVGAQFVALPENAKKALRVACTSAKGFKA